MFYPIKERIFGPVVFGTAEHLDANVEFITSLLEEEGPNEVAFRKRKARPHFQIATRKGFLRWDVSTNTDKHRRTYHWATPFP